MCFQVLDQYLEKGLLPITGGDVIVDENMGCTIWSTEKVLSFLADYFLKKGWQVNKIIHVTAVDGMLDHNQHTIPFITAQNWPEQKRYLNGVKGFDVTGGIAHKIEEALLLAQKNIQSFILSGFKKDNLFRALTGQDWIGTTIC